MSDYFDDAKNVEEYVTMAEGYDGRALVDALAAHLADGSSVLELGMGPGTDLLLLSQRFCATGSDRSTLFVERFRTLYPSADLLVLDAVMLPTERHFDALYSNKVLNHLSTADLRLSLRRQHALLNENGVALHSFWLGKGKEALHGLHFVYYTPERMSVLVAELASIGPRFDVVASQRYSELGGEEDDSFYIILRKC